VAGVGNAPSPNPKDMLDGPDCEAVSMPNGEPAEMIVNTTMSDGLQQTSSTPFFRTDSMYFLLGHYRLLLIVSALVGLISFFMARVTPEFLSVAYLRIDPDTSKTATALMHSAPVTDKVFSHFADIGDTPEARRRFVDSHVTLVPLAPNLFRFGVSYRDAKSAQLMSSLMLAAWLEMTKPSQQMREILQANLARAEQEAQTVDQLITQLRKEATTLVLPNSLPGELATPISNLITKRDQALVTAQNIRNQLRGVSPDAIAVPPDLPIEIKSKPWAISLVAALLTLLILISGLLIGRYFSLSLDRIEGGRWRGKRPLAQT
jgi:hypothetical protein